MSWGLVTQKARAEQLLQFFRDFYETNKEEDQAAAAAASRKN